MNTSTWTELRGTHWYHGRLGTRTSIAPQWEVVVFTIAMLVALVHFVDATSMHAQRGAAPPERALQVVLAVLLPTLAMVAYPYLRSGWRVVLALIFAFAAISTGIVIHVIGSVKNGPGSGDYTGFAWLAVGVVLFILGIAVFLTSLPNWRWRIGGVVLGALVATNLLFPATLAVYITHAPRYEIGSLNLGRDYEDVSFETADGLVIKASYIPSQNGAAVIVLHGSGGARIRPADHARMLIDRGFGVLLVDSRGHGESDGGTNALGWDAWQDVEAATEYVTGRPDVRDGRVGVLGLSMGAEIALDAGSRIQSLRAIVADGAGIRSVNEMHSLPFSWSRAREYPTVLVANIGVSLLSGKLPPPALEARVGSIETPTFLISSNVAEEHEINRIWRQRMHGDVELWEMLDTGHTAGLRTHPEAYENRVVGFLEEHLLD